MNTELWARAYNALEDLYNLRGGNAVIRVLSRFFNETKDNRFHFKQNKRAFSLLAIEDSWYSCIASSIEDAEELVRIGPEAAQKLLRPDANVLDVLGITTDQLERILKENTDE